MISNRSLLAILALVLFSNCASTQDRGRGFSRPGPLGKATLKHQATIDETQLSHIMVTKVTGEVGFINAGRTDGLAIGDTFRVARSLSGRYYEIGEIKIVAVLNESAVVEPKDKSKANDPLQVGDRLLKHIR